jgi:NAD(P)-dependent dehydrogenase (short-subunit alcohol dehydrogenase family)
MSDKRILLIGATSYIAGGIIDVLYQKGNYNLILTGRDEEKLSKIKKSHDHTESTTYLKLDLENVESIEKFCQNLTPVDGIVFCAGYNEYLPIKFLKSEVLEKIFVVNYFSFLSIIKIIIKKKLINKEGSIVAISSISSQLGVQGTTAYAASKAALNSTIKVIASELAARKVRANAICPGIVMSPMLNQDNLDVDQLKEQEKNYPLGFGTPADIGYAVSYLLSSDSRWITGNILNIDGGLTLSK